MGRSVPELATAARDVLSLLEAVGVPACVIGGLVVSRWGQPRQTTDVDLSVLAPYGEESRAIDSLLGRFKPRRTDAREFALQRRVLLLETEAGVGIDVALAAFPFETEAIDTASTWTIVPGVDIRTCSAEHLIVYKLVAARPQDLVDVQGIVRRQSRRLDVERIRRWGRELAELKDDPDLLQPFENALRALA
jgi:hypothetical protein